MTIAPINLIALDDRNRAVIIGTTARVTMIVRDARNGLTAQDIAGAYPYLNLAQIHAALAYYFENQRELDSMIEREDGEMEQLRAEAAAAGESFTRTQLEERLSQRHAS